MSDLNQATQETLTQLGFRLTGPFLENNVRTALEFFARRMPALDEETRLGFFRGMDLHKPIQAVWLAGGTAVAAFRRQGEPLFKLFYTKPGTSPYQLGVVPVGRSFHRFRVRVPAEVLAARAGDYVYASADDAAAARFSWALPGGGRGLQYIIPSAEHVLEEVPSPA